MNLEWLDAFSDARLQDLLAGFSKCRTVVVGDFFLDKYLDIDPCLQTTSIESGKTAHQVIRIRKSAGCAGTVVNNLASLGAGIIHPIGIIGDDGEGYDLRNKLREMGCADDDLIVTRNRMTPTYLKPRDAAEAGLSGEYERLDVQNRTPTPTQLVERVIRAMERRLPDVDAVIVADQVETDDCGVITRSVREALADFATRYPSIVFWADSRTHIQLFRNVSIKPNQFEAVGRTSPLPGETVEEVELIRALTRLRERNHAPVCITMGADGAVVSDPLPVRIPSLRIAGPIDTTGAGDSFTAGAVLALVSGAALPEAALVGNLTASVTIQQLAVSGVARPEQLLNRLRIWSEQRQERLQV
jgi:rfaE bifunctional protein kinase chain/domain